MCRVLSGLVISPRLERLISGRHICRVCVGFCEVLSGFVGFCRVLCGVGCRVQILVIQARIRENVSVIVRFCPEAGGPVHG